MVIYYRRIEKRSDIFRFQVPPWNLANDQGPGIHHYPKKMSFPVGESQLAGCLKIIGRWLLEVGPRHLGDNAQGVIENTFYETSINAATPG